MADHAFHMHSERTMVAVCAAVPVGGHAKHDDTRIDLSHHFVRYAQLIHRLGNVVLYKGIAYCYETLKDVHA